MKMAADISPNSGPSMRKASSMLASPVEPAAPNVTAATHIIAILTRPTPPKVKPTSMLEARTKRRNVPLSATGRRFRATLEWRKTACGITVAPTIPAASMTPSGPPKDGTKVW
jgi:hypothetical protein